MDVETDVADSRAQSVTTGSLIIDVVNSEPSQKARSPSPSFMKQYISSHRQLRFVLRL